MLGWCCPLAIFPRGRRPPAGPETRIGTGRDWRHGVRRRCWLSSLRARYSSSRCARCWLSGTPRRNRQTQSPRHSGPGAWKQRTLSKGRVFLLSKAAHNRLRPRSRCQHRPCLTGIGRLHASSRTINGLRPPVSQQMGPAATAVRPERSVEASNQTLGAAQRRRGDIGWREFFTDPPIAEVD